MCFFFSRNEKMTEWQSLTQRDSAFLALASFSLSPPFVTTRNESCERLRMYGGKENELLLMKMMRMVMLPCYASVCAGRCEREKERQELSFLKREGNTEELASSCNIRQSPPPAFKGRERRACLLAKRLISFPSLCWKKKKMMKIAKIL